jgi:hypothetical protein
LLKGAFVVLLSCFGEMVLEADRLLDSKRPKVAKTGIRFKLMKRRGSRVDRLFAVPLGFSKVCEISPLDAFV